MNQVTILTSTTCGYCHAAKDLLQRKGIDYQEVDAVKDHEHAQHLLAQSGRRTVPQIFINDKPIGGFTELNQFFNSSESDLSRAPVI